MKKTLFQLAILSLMLLKFMVPPVFSAKDTVVVIPLNHTTSLEPYAPVTNISPSNASYLPGTHTVTDKITGLVWQKAVDTVTRSWRDAWNYCRDLDRGGYTDWRLPNTHELMSIVDYNEYDPAINTDAFPSTGTGTYWAAPTDAGVSFGAWLVYFANGRVDQYSKVIDTTYYVRCVRTPPLYPGNFRDNGNGAVTDLATGLTWQKSDDDDKITQAEAHTYCQELDLAGSSDWRLPNIKELRSIVDTRVYEPATDISVFPDTKIIYFYWSSTTDESDSSKSWGIDFADGHTVSSSKSNFIYVRCVL